MKMRISVPTYQLVYEAGCEEMIWHGWGRKEGAALVQQARGREEERRRIVFSRY